MWTFGLCVLVMRWPCAFLPPPAPVQALQDSGRVFEEPRTGTVFEAPEGSSPERDKEVGGKGGRRVTQ